MMSATLPTVLVWLLGAAASAPLPSGEEADRAWRAGRRLAAIELAATELAQQPGNDALRDQLVGWEFAVGRYSAALEHMGANDGRRVLALFALARYADALEHVDPGEPSHVEAHLESLSSLGRFAEVDALVERAAELLGLDDPRVRTWRGQRWARAGEHTAAIAEFRMALELDPLRQSARFALGRALLASGEREEARRVLERHRELVPLVDRYDFARQSLDLNPNHAPNLAAVAELEAELGLLDRAAASYARAEASATDAERTPIALRHARFCEEVLGAPERATGVLERALERATDVRLLVRCADVHERQESWPEALAHLERAAELRPEDSAIRARIARVITAQEAEE